LRRIAKWAALAIGVVVLIAALTLTAVDTPWGHRFVAERIGAIRTPTGLRFAVGRIDGSLYSRARLIDVRVYDPQGLVFRTPAAELDWSPLRWFANRLDITDLHMREATFAKVPKLRSSGRHDPILPEFDIHIGRLAIDRLIVAPAMTGVAREGRVVVRADTHAGRALVDVAAVVAGTDALRLKLDAEPDRDRFDLDVRARGAASGVLARLTGVRRSIALDVAGDGRWSRWRGSAVGEVAGVRVADLRLAVDAGRYSLGGELRPTSLVRGKLQRLTAPRVLVSGAGTFADRRLGGTLSLRSPALAVTAEGAVDLATSSYRNLRVDARLLRPAALFPNMTGRDVRLRARFDGAFGTARFDYRLSAPRFAFDKTGFEDAYAAGSGRLSKTPVALPIRFVATRVTGVGDVAGGILRNLTLAGVLRIGPKLLTGDDLVVRSDKLSGRTTLVLDLATGRYDIGLNGGLGRYLIPGLGVVDVTTTLHVVPGPGGRGTRVVGTGHAEVQRLDNAFFRSLTGGLPRLVTGLERTPDKVLHFTNLRLVSPLLTLQGTGFRRVDGTFHFEGTGTHKSYGPLTLKLDGRIEKPTIDLVFARPSAALGLRDVRAHLAPTPAGFAFTAAGGSRAGPFAGEGAILLPRGGQAAIQVARLDVAGSRASGTVAIVAGGFDGRLTLAGGGLTGTLAFRPDNGVQRIDGSLDAARATIAGTRVRRGHAEFALRFDAAGTTVDATVTANGLRRGALRLARIAANVRLRGGAGEVRASIAGTRGRAFAIQTVTQVTADRIRVQAQGTLDGRPLALTSPAVLTRGGDAWVLAATGVSFAGGSAQVSGRFGTDTRVDAKLAAMPLSVLDIGYPGLGLSGAASGTLSYATGAAGPSGRANLTVRGLTRSGLVTTSQPIDLGFAGALSPARAAVRVIAASGGRTVGRAQALLTGDLTRDPANAQLFAQLRYDGPAGALWRLTGIELFDLSGPVQVGADVGGRVAAPTIRGLVRANGARIESATTGTVLTNVRASGRFAGSRLAIDSFAADAGKGGSATGAGTFDFAGANGVGLDLTVKAAKAVLIDRDDIGATVTGDLRFRSSGRGGTISGDVLLDRSRYRLGQASNVAALPKLNIREINVPGGDDAEDEAPAAPWTLAVHARAPGQLSVSGLGLRSEWSANIQIAGEPTNPAITGVARLIQGDYEFAGRQFELSRGVIRFAGETPANPSLDIEADADTPGLSATIRVTGVAQKPEISFASIPALPQDELLSRLLFGTSITNLSAPEALQLAAAVAALQNGDGGLNPINAVRRAAGLDRLRILPADPQTGQGTSVAAGKYVTRRLYAEIVTDGQGYSATRVEYLVTRWLSVLSSISTLGRTSANVRVSKDY
jgi:translocation and assembly module TamB